MPKQFCTAGCQESVDLHFRNRLEGQFTASPRPTQSPSPGQCTLKLHRWGEPAGHPPSRVVRRFLWLPPPPYSLLYFCPTPRPLYCCSYPSLHPFLPPFFCFVVEHLLHLCVSATVRVPQTCTPSGLRPDIFLRPTHFSTRDRHPGATDSNCLLFHSLRI